MRILEAAAAAMICTAAGAAFSSVLRRRCEVLRTLISLTDEMSAKIRYRAVPLSELIAELSGESGYSGCTFLKRVAARTENGFTVQSAWSYAAESLPFLTETDRGILSDLGARLGETDTEGQLSILALAGEMLGRSLEAAESECERRSRPVFGIWFLFGIGTGIVIL